MMLVCCGVIAGLQTNWNDELSVKKLAGQPVEHEPDGWKLMSVRKQIAKRRTPPTGGWVPTTMLYGDVSNSLRAWLETCKF